MFRQLVLLILLSSLQPGRLHAEGTDVNEMFQSLNDNIGNLNSMIKSYIKQFGAQMEESISSLRADLSSLNVSVSNLSVCLQEHKQQTAAELAQLQTFLKSKLETVIATTFQLLNDHEEIQNNVSNMECIDKEEDLMVYKSVNDNLTHLLKAIQINTLRPGPYTCGGTGGWRRAVYLDMTDPSTTCPSGWNMTGYSKRTCGRATNGYWICDSVTFPVSGGEYSRVCGRINAYQWGAVDAFYSDDYEHPITIDSAYVGGVSVTHGRPREHIWTFAAGAAEGSPRWDFVCPCDADHTIHIPSFVGNDYFCESGVNEPWSNERHRMFHSNDILWDGENCLSSSTCCSLHNPPYFIKQLPSPTTDGIEVRICPRYDIMWANIAIELIDLYVQ